MDQGVPVSVRVVEAVAERNGVDPMDLEPRLHDVVDPDALDSLFVSGGETGEPTATLEFTYAGCSVTVESSARVSVTELQTVTEPQPCGPRETRGD